MPCQEYQNATETLSAINAPAMPTSGRGAGPDLLAPRSDRDQPDADSATGTSAPRIQRGNRRSERGDDA